jgi:hypothetical protein
MRSGLDDAQNLPTQTRGEPELLGFWFADVRLRPYVSVGIAKEIGRTPFPKSSGSVHEGPANQARWRRNFFPTGKCCDRWDPRA